MITKNDLLAYFWANANQLVSRHGVEMDLHGEDLVVMSLTLRNVEEYPYTVQLRTEFELDYFVGALELQRLDNILEINIQLLFELLAVGKASYHVFEV